MMRVRRTRFRIPANSQFSWFSLLIRAWPPGVIGVHFLTSFVKEKTKQFVRLM
jgi:hypothetical protein